MRGPDLDKLSSPDRRAVIRFVAWVKRVTADATSNERFEAISGEGKVKVLHMRETIPRDRF